MIAVRAVRSGLLVKAKRSTTYCPCAVVAASEAIFGRQCEFESGCPGILTATLSLFARKSVPSISRAASRHRALVREAQNRDRQTRRVVLSNLSRARVRRLVVLNPVIMPYLVSTGPATSANNALVATTTSVITVELQPV